MSATASEASTISWVNGYGITQWQPHLTGAREALWEERLRSADGLFSFGRDYWEPRWIRDCRFAETAEFDDRPRGDWRPALFASERRALRAAEAEVARREHARLSEYHRTVTR
jgi:hypothetical protein